jgi:hypothetical protein
MMSDASLAEGDAIAMEDWPGAVGTYEVEFNVKLPE